jgi:hypothetical protein
MRQTTNHLLTRVTNFSADNCCLAYSALQRQAKAASGTTRQRRTSARGTAAAHVAGTGRSALLTRSAAWATAVGLEAARKSPGSTATASAGRTTVVRIGSATVTACMLLLHQITG